MTVAAVVLAAGGGRRWRGEGHKLLAVVRGRPVVGWAVQHALDAGLDETVVVTGAVDLAPVLPPAVAVVHNARWADGQATSLRAALTWAADRGHEAVVVGLGDQPFVSPETWKAVAACDAPIAVATYEGRRRNPVRLAAEVWPLLPVAGDEGARVLMRERPQLVSEVACVGQPADVDTVEDLEEWS
jgi:CTP:molybdopterin cytidylyltransferase MocA